MGYDLQSLLLQGSRPTGVGLCSLHKALHQGTVRGQYAIILYIWSSMIKASQKVWNFLNVEINQLCDTD